MPTPRHQPGQPSPQEIVQALHTYGLNDKSIALLVCCSRSTIWHIRIGEQSGRNIAPRLQQVVKVIQENARRAGTR